MSPFSLVVFGDPQNQNEVTKRMVARAAEIRPDLCIILGDLVNNAADPALWDGSDRVLKPLTDICEVVAVPGNHDYEAPGRSPQFDRRFRPQTPSPWNSIQRAGCRFLLLDTVFEAGDPWEPGSLSANSPQLQWLENELTEARHQGQRSLVFAHHPVFLHPDVHFSTSPTIRASRISEGFEPGNLLPVLLREGAHGFFAGHIHLYERCRYEEMNFITSGATGYPFPDLPESGNPFSVVCREVSHLCHIRIHPDTIRGEAIDESGTPIDEWDMD